MIVNGYLRRTDARPDLSNILALAGEQGSKGVDLHLKQKQT